MKTIFSFFFMLIFTFYMSFSSFWQESSSVFAQSCTDVEIIFARGSGSPLNGPDYQSFHTALKKFLTSAPKLSFHFYELGSSSQQGYQYPAINIEDPKILTGTIIGAGNTFSFGKSIELGVKELKAYTRHLLTSCPNTKIVLAGYSQGALVIDRSLDAIPSSSIAYVATFGDPKLYLPEGNGILPDACYGKNISPYRIDVPDCHTHHGILGATNPYQPSGLAGKLGAWCNNHDFMCGSTFDPKIINSSAPHQELLKPHLSYKTDNSYTHASKIILSALSKVYPQKISLKHPHATAIARDTAILIDATGSMRKVIEKYKAEAFRLAKQTIATDGRIALFIYRDLATEDPAFHQLCDFSCTLDQFKSALNSIRPDGGGDEPESALSASLHVMNKLSWQKGATKSLVLLTDATYHSPDLDGTTLPQLVQRSLEIDPVNIYVVAPDNLRKTYQALTEQTNGRFFNLDEANLSSDLLLTRPEAKLNSMSYSGEINRTFFFDASTSTSNLPIVRYEWDLDSDGIFETSTTTPTTTISYKYPFSGFIQVKVSDQKGQTSTMSAPITVATANPTPPSLSNLQLSSSHPNTQLTFSPSPNTALTAVVVNETFLGFTSESQLTFSTLPPNTNITLTPIAQNGTRGTTISISTKKQIALLTSDSSSRPFIDISKSKKSSKFIPKAPNTGRK